MHGLAAPISTLAATPKTKRVGHASAEGRLVYSKRSLGRQGKPNVDSRSSPRLSLYAHRTFISLLSFVSFPLVPTI